MYIYADVNPIVFYGAYSRGSVHRLTALGLVGTALYFQKEHPLQYTMATTTSRSVLQVYHKVYPAIFLQRWQSGKENPVFCGLAWFAASIAPLYYTDLDLTFKLS